MVTKIQSLLKQPEGKTLEFKRDLSSRRNILRTLVAFANSAGGKLIIGVEDRTQKPVGVSDPLDQEERLCSMIADSIEPRLVPNIELVSLKDKTLLLVEVFLSNSRPHRIRTEGEAGVYVRLGSTNRQADPDLINEIKRSVDGIVFDELPNSQLSSNDIDLDAINSIFERKRRFSNQQLQTLKLLVEDQGRLVPTNGSLLLFGKDREQHFPDAWVQCGRFKGKTKADMLDHIEIHDHLPWAVEKMMAFLQKHAMRRSDFSELKRKDIWNIPITILREAIINAVVHADYSQKGAPVRLAFYDDRIEIDNPGLLLPGLTVDDLKQGVSKIRNRVIARVFRELELIEQWGSGLPRIFSEAKKLGLPIPEIQEIGMQVRFTVFHGASDIEDKVTSELGNKLGNRLGNKLGKTKEKILTQMKTNPKISATQLAKIIEISMTAVEKNIKQLREDGMIKRVGGTRGHWEVIDE
ncbi:MAG: HTH domain-containing protein [Deltaproteobacteria bacterium]|jgi:ATP-dependent DNA helicase RecG|nr:HTH domain-containing protein [Deltaproteobacteria bacterium]MBT4525547.1 HTH domain-containing protein [Deltaproteobacteria bacterium]